MRFALKATCFSVLRAGLPYSLLRRSKRGQADNAGHATGLARTVANRRRRALTYYTAFDSPCKTKMPIMVRSCGGIGHCPACTRGNGASKRVLVELPPELELDVNLELQDYVSGGCEFFSESSAGLQRCRPNAAGSIHVDRVLLTTTHAYAQPRSEVGVGSCEAAGTTTGTCCPPPRPSRASTTSEGNPIRRPNMHRSKHQVAATHLARPEQSSDRRAPATRR